MRKPIFAISCCIALLLLGYCGYRGYLVWKQNHWVNMAKIFAAKNDAPNEFLSLQQALSLNPQNLEAAHMMADFGDLNHSSEALFWRQRILELNPRSLQDRLALAQTAVAFRNFSVASNALFGVDANGKKTALYHNVAGVVASAAGQITEAESHFAEAARLSPNDPTPQLNLAVLRLHSSNAVDVAAARVSLRQISQTATNHAVRSQAQRERVMDALSLHDFATALPLAQELAQPTNAAFSDKLLHLEVLLQSKSHEFKNVVKIYEREATTSPDKLSDMATWLMHRTTAEAALTWLQSLPMTAQTNQPAAFLVAQCLFRLHNWHDLQSTIQNENWNDLEFVRHAFLARALREQALSETSIAEWTLALKLASQRKGSLISLFRFAADWNWNTEAEQILWIVVNRYPEEIWAAPVLTHALMDSGRTRPLMQLFSVMSKRFPNDVETKNDLAYTAMLLDAQELSPYELSQQVYDKVPQNPSYASTYAFSLYLQKKFPEALKVMQKIAPNDLATPSIAGYYAIILKANGYTEKAREYMKLTANTKLLPEEQLLFQQAMMN
jgi:tetratricopeptide (TPR) repeat protein